MGLGDTNKVRDDASATPLWRKLLRKPRTDRDRLYFVAFLGLTLAFVFMGVREIYGPHGYLAWRHQRDQYNSLRRDIGQLERENQELQKNNERLNAGDPEAIEQVAREQMHLARPGERIYTLPQRDSDPHSAENLPPR